MAKWFNGIKTSPDEVRQAIKIGPTALFDAVQAEPDFDQIVQIKSEVAQKETDYSSDKVETAFAVGLASIASTEAIAKKTIVDSSLIGGVFDAVSSGLTGLGLTKFNLPLSAIKYFIPYAKAEKEDHASLMLYHKFPFGDDALPDDARPPNRNHIEAVKVELKFKGGFLVTDDDGDSWFQISASISSLGKRDIAKIILFGEPSADKFNKSKKADAGTLHWSGNELRVNTPRRTKIVVPTDKKIDFAGTLTISVPTPKMDHLPLTLHLGLSTYADSDFSIGVTSNNATSAWIEPFLMTLQPIHAKRIG